MDLQMNLEMMGQLYWMGVLYDTDKGDFNLWEMPRNVTFGEL